MTQSRAMSLVEAIVNVLIGFVVSLISQIVIFHAYDVKLSLADNVMITIWFTVISILRSYAVRRMFVGMQLKRITR